jgi:hypothetical protein
LIIKTAVYSYHRPGQKALEIYYLENDGGIKSVALKAIAIFGMILLVISFPFSFLTVTILYNAIMMN